MLAPTIKTFANLHCIPLRNKVHSEVHEEVHFWLLVVAHLASLQSNDNLNYIRLSCLRAELDDTSPPSIIYEHKKYLEYLIICQGFQCFFSC